MNTEFFPACSAGFDFASMYANAEDTLVVRDLCTAEVSAEVSFTVQEQRRDLFFGSMWPWRDRPEKDVKPGGSPFNFHFNPWED